MNDCKGKDEYEPDRGHCYHTTRLFRPAPGEPLKLVCCWCGDVFMGDDVPQEHGRFACSRAFNSR